MILSSRRRRIRHLTRTWGRAAGASSMSRSRRFGSSIGELTDVCDNRLMAREPIKESGDEKLAELFAEFGGQMVSPGGAAALLGLSRKTIYTLCKQQKLRAF